MRVIAKSLSQPPKKTVVLDREYLRRLTVELNRVLTHIDPVMFGGVKVTMAPGGSFTADAATLKISVATIGKSGEVVTREASDFKKYASLFNLKPDDLGKTFTSPHTGTLLKIVGAKMKSRKYPILVQDVNSGKQYKYPESLVAFGLKKGGV